MKKIIHIASDEKFINSAYWQFNTVFPNQNIFYLLVDNPEGILEHVERTDDFKLVGKNLQTIKDFAQDLGNPAIICFHGLDYFRSIILNMLSKETKVIWFLWGMEIHNNPKIAKNLEICGASTYSTFYASSKKKKFIGGFKNLFRQLFYKLTLKGDSAPNAIYKALKKADYCAILYQEEFQYVKERIKTDIKYFKFSYYPIELMVRDKNARANSDNILLGNSASESNNHLEAFQILQELPLKERKVIVPLSYGNSNYRKVILERGKRALNGNFEPLVDFMPLHVYNTFLEQCGIVIMNHYRQQAVGNVLTMLWMGAKVYLDERNSLYHYLKRIGVYVFSVQEDLRKDNPNLFSLLSTAKRDTNRKILETEIGQDHLLEELRMQLGAIADES